MGLASLPVLGTRLDWFKLNSASYSILVPILLGRYQNETISFSFIFLIFKNKSCQRIQHVRQTSIELVPVEQDVGRAIHLLGSPSDILRTSKTTDQVSALLRRRLTCPRSYTFLALRIPTQCSFCCFSASFVLCVFCLCSLLFIRS